MKRQPNNNGGFSLLEVILAMAILAIISIPLLSYFTQSMKYNAMMADKQHATNLAQEVLEDLKNQKELAVVTTGAGFRVPYLEGNGYTLLRETPAAAPAPAFQAENVYYAAAGTSGSTYDVEVSVSTAAAENDTNIPQIEGIDDTKDVVALEHNQLQEAMTYFSEKNMTYAAAHPGTLPLGDSELQAKMKRKFSVTADSTHVRVACSYTCGETGDEVLGIDPSEVYECNEFAEEDIRDVEHIYLMYHVAQDSDTMEVTYAAGVNPKLVFVCQNIADVNSIRPDYKMTVLPQGCPMPSVASNLGNKSYPDDPAAVTNKGAIYQDSFKLPAGSVAPLVASSGGVRKVDLTVCVYKKGKGGNNPDKGIKYRHTWNIVKVGGVYYHLDATFDNTLGKDRETSEIRYDYFNLDDSQIFRDHEPLIAPAPHCGDHEHFYYKEKKLSFTKKEDVYKRSLQAAKKGRVLIFHWRGGYLTKEVLKELLELIRKAGDEKDKTAMVSINWPQAVIRVQYTDMQVQESVTIEEANEGEK